MLNLQALLVWVLIGMVTGGAGQAVRGERRRIAGEAAAAIIGAVLGGLIFVSLGLRAGGLLGSMAVALLGAVMLLLLIRTIRTD